MNLVFAATVRIRSTIPGGMERFIAHAREELLSDYHDVDDTNPGALVADAINECSTDTENWLTLALADPSFGLTVTVEAVETDTAKVED